VFDRSQKLIFMGYLTLLQMILRLQKAIKRCARCVVLLVDARAPRAYGSERRGRSDFPVVLSYLQDCFFFLQRQQDKRLPTYLSRYSRTTVLSLRDRGGVKAFLQHEKAEGELPW
jgi:hypothetical protein